MTRWPVPRSLRVVAVLAAASCAAVRSVAAQHTTLESVATDGTQSDSFSGVARVSDDGLSFAFWSGATVLVAHDTNGVEDVFWRDHATGETRRVSVASDGSEGDLPSRFPDLSADGRFVSFGSLARNLVSGDANGVMDIFVHDTNGGVTERVSVSSSGAEADGTSTISRISADGRFVAFESRASNLVGGDLNDQPDIFLRDRQGGTTAIVSVATDGSQTHTSSQLYSLSADGRYVLFGSGSHTLVPNDTNQSADLFVRDTVNGTTERVSLAGDGSELDDDVLLGQLSANGRYVVFSTVATNTLPGDVNGLADLYLRDLANGTVELVSVNDQGGASDDATWDGVASDDGRFVTFWSDATNLVRNDGNARADLFARDRSFGVTLLISMNDAGFQGDNESSEVDASSDGRFVAFRSFADDLVPGDANGRIDCFLRARFLGSASWSNYGSGHSGTFGVPTLTLGADPVITTRTTLRVDNSAGVTSCAVGVLGLEPAALPGMGGTLLVDPLFFLPIVLAPGTVSIAVEVAADDALLGRRIYAQFLEVDAGASRGVSMTPGLLIVPGL